MSRFEEIQSQAGQRGKALLETVVDLAEWVLKKNLAVANDSTKFAVTQLRLPAEVSDLASYRQEVRDAYGEFGSVLREHGGDIVAKLREVPTDIRKAMQAKQEKTAAQKAKSQAKTARKKASKKISKGAATVSRKAAKVSSKAAKVGSKPARNKAA